MWDSIISTFVSRTEEIRKEGRLPLTVFWTLKRGKKEFKINTLQPASAARFVEGENQSLEVRRSFEFFVYFVSVRVFVQRGMRIVRV